MSGDSSTERIEISNRDLPGARPILPITVGMDNVYHAETPAGLVAGVQTEWDATTLDSAVTWLEDHARYVERLVHQMTDIKQLMEGGEAGGSEGPKSPLGGFHHAGELAQRHTALYSGTESVVRQLYQDLYDAAEALRQVKRNYDTAEEANAMSAADMQSVFGDVRNDGGSR